MSTPWHRCPHSRRMLRCPRWDTRGTETATDAPSETAATPTTAKGVIDAYFAAVEAGDKDAAHAMLTGEEAEGAKSSKKSFTYVFFEMGFKVKTWELKSEVEEKGDEANGHVKAVLIDDKGKDDKEGMRFKLVRTDGKWLIAEIN